MTTATAVGHVEMRLAKVVGLATAEDQPFHYVVLEEAAGDRQLAIAIGQAEAFNLAARLGGIAWRRPMTYQFVAALVQALGGRVLKVRIDRVEEETYIATVGWKARPAYSWWTRGPAPPGSARRWSRHRSLPPLQCYKRQRPDTQGIPLKHCACVGRWQLAR